MAERQDIEELIENDEHEDTATFMPQAYDLALNVLNLARNTLLVNLRFMDRALSMFIPSPNEELNRSLSTNGACLFFNPMRVLTEYKEEQTALVRNYLHLVLHCVFRHPFVGIAIDIPYWNLACDIAVENVINEIKTKSVVTKRQKLQVELISELKKDLKYITAEKLYRHYKDKQLSDAEFSHLCNLFVADEHDEWYKPCDYSGISAGPSQGAPQNRPSNNGGASPQPSSSKGPSESNSMPDIVESSLQQQWSDISHRMQTDLNTFSNAIGKESSSLMQELTSVNREKYDYSGFLRQFSALGESMKINEDEFDYIFYTYGLRLYPDKKMPLIEPLEYKEVKKIREFVIAIDTSGSVQGELVQKFLQKTYNIFLQEESFFKKFNVHIIQCDANIQEDVKITNQREFNEYLASMQLRGFGGTDFRPVFNYVEKLRANKEFVNLKGLIYFTDGYGTFPEKKTDYNTAFVFIDDNYGQPEVPSWAIKLVLQSDEI